MVKPISVLLLVVPLTLASVPPVDGQAARDSLAQAGWEALKQGDADRASLMFADALKQHPTNALLHLGAGAAAHMLGRQQDAADYLTRALALEPKLTAASALLGEIEYDQGKLEAAIERYEQALPFARGDTATDMQSLLDEWRKEATVHRRLTRASDARFSVLFDGQSDNALAARAVGVLERAFTRIGENLGAYPSNRVILILYTEREFRAITHAPSWSDGSFDGKIRIPVKGVEHDREHFDRVLVHELAHAMIHGLAPRGVPNWLHEGLASYFEPSDVTEARRRIQARGIVVPFAALQDSFRGLSAGQAAAAYDQSLVAADLLARTLSTRLAGLLRGIGRGLTFNEAMAQSGLRVSDFEEQVLRRLKP